MSINDEGPSKCGRKTALSIFFAFELFGFIFSLIAVLSPSWQYVYLEGMPGKKRILAVLVICELLITGLVILVRFANLQLVKCSWQVKFARTCL
ncbi:unnamed protein product [Toxocara canis]|uniref:Uncharacterized protein n=1 Tax=Toxocara canis TaxID=6265 RepID=A0A183U4N5_TOXCA|nr:unnamed protein product [Toxocara canis]